MSRRKNFSALLRESARATITQNSMELAGLNASLEQLTNASDSSRLPVAQGKELAVRLWRAEDRVSPDHLSPIATTLGTIATRQRTLASTAKDTAAALNWQTVAVESELLLARIAAADPVNDVATAFTQARESTNNLGDHPEADRLVASAMALEGLAFLGRAVDDHEAANLHLAAQLLQGAAVRMRSVMRLDGSTDRELTHLQTALGYLSWIGAEAAAVEQRLATLATPKHVTEIENAKPDETPQRRIRKRRRVVPTTFDHISRLALGTPHLATLDQHSRRTVNHNAVFEAAEFSRTRTQRELYRATRLASGIRQNLPRLNVVLTPGFAAAAAIVSNSPAGQEFLAAATNVRGRDARPVRAKAAHIVAAAAELAKRSTPNH